MTKDSDAPICSKCGKIIKDEENELKQYLKVTGIEAQRRDKVPVTVHIPKKLRRSSSGGFCSRCLQNTMEGYEDGHGMWHYRCPNCVAHQDKNDPNPCPRCGCRAHHDSMGDKTKTSTNPLMPEIIKFVCLNCCFMWYNPEYEKYLLTRAIK